jgi:hypothetical protein
VMILKQVSYPLKNTLKESSSLTCMFHHIVSTWIISYQLDALISVLPEIINH